ncbi:477a0596-ebc6-4e34-a37e-42370da4b99b [Sclerotinia trifoliorum]|uniref:477a0596-ebc6-4e34-a37e-42370da4b99b n=1 Tax=Sclerotinia trifoliorum TaxID=28548 RepID=A0A8H2W091_9HELO|nr:477a0596-ebc6-4e34-a37e-42370da4b99b [Sclerotinia trifoliorum]
MINSTAYWVGSFGLGASVGNYSYVTPNSTYTLLESMGEIVGAGYGYTAGAVYQQKGEPMSLTLGGYDENRFIHHNISFTLTQDPAVPQAFVESISVSSSNGSNKSIQLASAGDMISALIDSSTPYLWLPEAVCDRFADALGLTYNESLNLYTFDENPNQHNNLSDSSTATTFTFRFKDTSTDTDIVEINLPYAAFDLQLTYPYIPNSEYGTDQASKFYFPLARSANTSQYTIGRVFLQEAYIITSYETNQFSLHQAVHVYDTLNNKSIVAIPSGGVTTGQKTGTVVVGSKTEEARLSNGKIAAIVLSVAGTLAIMLATLYFSCLKNFKPNRLSLNSKNSTSESEAGGDFQQLHNLASVTANGSENPNNNNTPVEINSDAVAPTAINFESPHQLELATAIPGELSTGRPVELPAVIPADRSYKAFTLDTSPTASSTFSSLSTSQSGSLPSNTTLTANYAGPSPERGSIRETLPRPFITSGHVSPMFSERILRPENLHPIGDTECRLNPPPTYALTQRNNYACAEEMPSSNQLPNQFPPSTGNRAGEPSSYDFAEEMLSGIQPPNLINPTTRNQDTKVDERRNHHTERQERGAELSPQSLAHDESAREIQFQARRHTHRLELERMERQGIDHLKYLNGDVGDIQNPFRALDQTHVLHGSYDLVSGVQGQENMFREPAGGAGPNFDTETAPLRFSFEKGDDLCNISSP